MHEQNKNKCSSCYCVGILVHYMLRSLRRHVFRRAVLKFAFSVLSRRLSIRMGSVSRRIAPRTSTLGTNYAHKTNTKQSIFCYPASRTYHKKLTHTILHIPKNASCGREREWRIEDRLLVGFWLLFVHNCRLESCLNLGNWRLQLIKHYNRCRLT